MSHKFKPLCVGTLPRVFVNLLAMDDENIVALVTAMNGCEEMKSWYSTTYIGTIRVHPNFDDSLEVLLTRQALAEFFRSVLDLSKVSRGMFVKDFDRLLNELGNQDIWGTEGQCDPRGDRRDADPYGN